MASGGNSTLRSLVYELPLEQLPELKGLVAERLCRETLRSPVPAPPPTDEPSLTVKDATRRLRCSEWTVYQLARAGELGGEQSKTNGRWHFTAAGLAAYRARHTRGLARGVDQRYSPPHADDLDRRATTPAPPRVDAARTGGGAQRDRDNRRPLGTRRARRHAPGSDRPCAPGAAAWATRPPRGDDDDPEG
jgi:hypothetical protein